MRMAEPEGRKEKRKHVRVPVRVPLKVQLDGEEKLVEFNTHIIDYSYGGVCIEWDLCEECTGYTFGTIDPKCIFAPYGSHAETTKSVNFYVRDEKTGEEYHFTGKAVYTSKTEEKEKIGIQFIDMTDDVRGIIHP